MAAEFADEHGGHGAIVLAALADFLEAQGAVHLNYGEIEILENPATLLIWKSCEVVAV